MFDASYPPDNSPGEAPGLRKKLLAAKEALAAKPAPGASSTPPRLAAKSGAERAHYKGFAHEHSGQGPEDAGRGNPEREK